MTAKILLVEDEAAARFGMREFLETHGFAVEEAASAAAALAAFRDFRPDAAIVDYALPDGNALELLPRLREIEPGVPVMILTGHGSIDLAVRAIKEGAEQFLTKPVELPALLIVLRRLLEDQRNRQKQLAGRVRESRAAVDPFAGTSPAIRRLADAARKVLSSESPILIQGETGAGKGVLARWLHDNGPRAEEAFVDLNCASLSREFLETELFGHEKGAFTGAVARKLGLLEIAHRGTVFLDEIGDMDTAVQPKLLTVLEEKRFRRMAAVRDQCVDVRLIAATHQDLATLMRERAFRSDLYYRISTLPLMVPPLRERIEDIPLLARTLLQSVAADLRRGAVTLSSDAERALAAHVWTGNVRELRNVLERAVLLSDRTVLEARDLSLSVEPAALAGVGDADVTLLELERRHIETVLRSERGHVERAATRLGVPRSSLYEKVPAATGSSCPADDSRPLVRPGSCTGNDGPSPSTVFARTHAGAMSARTPHRILVVDDQPSILFAMSEYLQAHDYVVDCALDRVEAAALLARHAYGVVIADLRLTPARDDDGLDVLSAVYERSPATCTILLTAYGSPAVERDARRRGADVVIQKPQPLGEIVRLVERLLAGPPRAS